MRVCLACVCVHMCACVYMCVCVCVRRNLTAADLLDESKAGSIDFPESVVGLMRGDLGFPHRGFPEAIEKVGGWISRYADKQLCR